MRLDRAELVERRARLFVVLVCLCFAILLGRLWVLQIIRGAESYRRSVQYTTCDIVIPAPRGVFYDRHGRLLVGNRFSYSVVGLVDTLKRHPEVMGRLAKLLDCPLSVLEERLSLPRIPAYQLYPVAKDIPVRTAMRIQESMELAGFVEVQEVSCRNYLFGDFATHALGYLREISGEELERLASSGYQLGDMIGKTGLEKTLEPYARGENGVRRIEIDRYQKPVGVVYYRGPISGLDARLTLDFDVQKAAEEALRARLDYLQRYTKYHRAKAGAVIALDPRNGEILAMASQPSFDPNLFVDIMPAETFTVLNNNPDKPFNNRVLRGLYPPASTFKPFTVFAALQEGKVSPDETFYCSGFDRIYGNLAKCWAASQGGHGRLDLVGGLKNSCNAVMYELGRRLGVERLAHYTRMLPFGRPTGIDLAPGEAAGIVPDIAFKKKLRPRDPWRELETMHFAIGQGYLEVTPLQMAVAYACIANGGRVLQPWLVREIRTLDKKLVRSFTGPRDSGRVELSEGTQAILMAGLNEVVSGGTAAGAFAGFPLRRYPVAGKTGTGQKKGYDDFSLFACFAPADKPRIVVVVVIEQGGAGSAAAAPVARRVLEAFFHLPPAVRASPVAPAPETSVLPTTDAVSPGSAAPADETMPGGEPESVPAPAEQGGNSSG